MLALYTIAVRGDTPPGTDEHAPPFDELVFAGRGAGNSRATAFLAFVEPGALRLADIDRPWRIAG
jgi:hypothetical protein